MCKDNTLLWLILLIVILIACSTLGKTSTPLNFDTFFELESSSPF